jgi:hypothetical protein
MLRPMLLALTALLFAAPAAQACIDQPLSKPFTPWLDYAPYQAAPEEWALDGAAFAPGGQPWGGGSTSISIPAGASAVTDPVCITLVHPTLRFFARGTLGTLAVSVIALDGALEVPVGVVLGTGAWSPSPVLPIVLNLLGEQDVRLKFTSVLGSFRIDDVWIDPYSKG